jgi:hypothetical protein
VVSRHVHTVEMRVQLPPLQQILNSSGGVKMDAKRIIASLNGLRNEWAAHGSNPEFADRSQWLSGVLKGIDLAIWIIHTESQRPG